jgi:hypothetical protein
VCGRLPPAAVLGRRRLFGAHFGLHVQGVWSSVMCGQKPSAAARCTQAFSHRHAALVSLNLLVQKLSATILAFAM